MATANTLPFQYLLRGDRLAQLDGQMLAATHEQRDRDLEDHLGNLPRLVAVGALQTPNPVIAAGVLGNVTDPITLRCQLGRYYRINLRIRALGATAGPVQIALSTNTGVNTGDSWKWIGGNYDGFSHQWLFAGTGISQTFVGMIRAGAAIVTVFTDTDGHFYVEDLGPVVAP